MLPRIQLKQHPVVHISVKSFKCKLCEKTFEKNTTYQTTTNWTTNILIQWKKKLPASSLSEEVHMWMYIKNHMSTHTNVKAHECEICKKRFSQNVSLNCHIKIHTGYKPFGCNVCCRRFRTSSGKNYRLKTHHQIVTDIQKINTK